MTGTALNPTHTHGSDAYGEFGTVTLDEADLQIEPPDDDGRLLRLSTQFRLLSDLPPEELF